MIPTPVLSEMMVRADSAGSEYYRQLNNTSRFKIAPFDARAAIEAGLTQSAAIKAGDKRSGLDGPWAKIKFDRQIVAISAVQHADEIISDDNGLRNLAASFNIPSISVIDLPIPGSTAQQDMFPLN